MSDDDKRADDARNDGELEFGMLREAEPAERRRPDRDRHYAVQKVGQPAVGDLPIFVEADAWRELVEHAGQDTTVELGGVLLGGMFRDDQRQPFVLVTDSLRAEHYEATRGSFKFTHDTWAAITRRRAEFNGDVQMVGWYHTHPDWGVFLSSMDLFICDHFFAKPLDVALVLDPCRAEWGWFQWSGRAGEPPRRTGGFYLIAAHNRQAELANLASVFSPAGESTMPAASRWSALPSPTGSTPSPVIHIHQPPAPIQPTWPLLAMLLLQTLLIVVIGWRIAAPVGSTSAGGANPAATDDTLRRWLAAERGEAKLAAQAELMDRVLEALAASPEGAFHQLAELQEHNVELTSSLRAQQAQERELLAQQASRAQLAEREHQTQQNRIADLTSRQARLREELNESHEKLANVSERLRALDPEFDQQDGQVEAALPWYRSPLAMSVGAVVVIAALAAGWWSQQRRAPIAESAGPSP